MIYFFGTPASTVFVLQANTLSPFSIEKLSWLFGGCQPIPELELKGTFIGPIASTITPWSTNAVEITQNMAIEGVLRIETFNAVPQDFMDFDAMLLAKYDRIDQRIYTVQTVAEPIKTITDIAAYNANEGLSLSQEEIDYLKRLSQKLGRPLTDSEVFGFSQVNSEHCRHKIFNGSYIIDGVEQPSSLFKLIKKTSEASPNTIVSAYKDNVAFIKGSVIEQFAPKHFDIPDFYEVSSFESVISLKAETHNFPTTVEPFNGAATGSGGEIRDRMAGGKGSLPLAGTAVYMTPFSRLADKRAWEEAMPERPWRYQTPMDILIKASNGASDFGNKFGQPLIVGSVYTFEHQEGDKKWGYDKVIMLAGGVGMGKAQQSLKEKPQKPDKILVLGGDNYRIGLGGAAVSSVNTGALESGIELNAIQRSNPEMQKRVANVVRSLVESAENPIVSIHDHGAGGHLNCLSELVEESGGAIDVDKLPIGDPTLSLKELMGNESQERMGLVVPEKHIDYIRRIAERERAPIYDVGSVTEDLRFRVYSSKTSEVPIDLSIGDMLGSPPKLVIRDQTIATTYKEVTYEEGKLYVYLEQVLQLESVACKDWLTNKVDRCVTGRVAKQQTVGPLQLPLNNVGVVALDYTGKDGIATSIGHAPATGLICPVAGSRNSIAEALTNIVWAPLKNDLESVSLSANWMWASKNKGEDARLYAAVKSCSDFAIELGINIPTGKDSLSMTQKYKDYEVTAPGTLIVSASAHCIDITAIVEPVFQNNGQAVYYINMSDSHFALGGSVFAQTLNKVGSEAPTIKDSQLFKNTFNALQKAIKNKKISSGHDVSCGGLITTLLELCFSQNGIAADLDLSVLEEPDIIKLLFSENSGVVFQTDASTATDLHKQGVKLLKLGDVCKGKSLEIQHFKKSWTFDIETYRDIWYKTSYLLDLKQSGDLAKERYANYKKQPLVYAFPSFFTGTLPQNTHTKRPVAAVIREKGSNSEREMAYALYLSGFDVKDVHMTDLISGRENLEHVSFIGAVGGFSNSDVLGSAKGWAGSFLYNEKARRAITRFFEREDTLSVGICNGCQLFVELGLITPEHNKKPIMAHNRSGKFECVFTSVVIQKNDSVMMHNLAGSTLGIWSAHGEGRFVLPLEQSQYSIVGVFAHEGYPSNPNGSDYNAAMLSSENGRHLVSMPHLERSTFPWNWAYYPKNRTDAVSPWLQAFVNARDWLVSR